jgi:hypothetical protein
VDKKQSSDKALEAALKIIVIIKAEVSQQAMRKVSQQAMRQG